MVIYKEWKKINRTYLSLEEAIAILSEKLYITEVEEININQAINRVAFRDICAPVNVPAFPRSRVDGYAVHENDCRASFPLILKKMGKVPAGDKNKQTLVPGTTIKLMTGAPIPLNTGAVVKQEDSKKELGNIKIPLAPDINAFIEPQGAMLEKGQLIIAKGQIFTPLIIEQVANAGIDKVKVFQKPPVYLINSGSELQLPGYPLEFGEIHNSNQGMFTSLLAPIAARVILGNGQLLDDMDSICTEIENGFKTSDLLIITGGNSDGDWDLIPLALEKIGAKPLVAGLDLRPGNKTFVASYGSKLIFNISGNPHAGYILFNILIKPIIQKMQGLVMANDWFPVRLKNGQEARKKVRYFCKGALISENNELGAITLRKNQVNNASLKMDNYPGFIAPLVLDIPSGAGEKGDIVRGLLI